ncbi:MAG TPA: DUF2142 domain-containing protein [Desulfuromonadaceae bacterium]|nr:DUF2142 domain-containing protein [Desulfuromonadaceae bacterium]
MPETPPPISGTRERRIVWLACGLATLHVFLFSAAFPFFNNTDEDSHFDLVVKYAHNDIPLDHSPEESLRFLATYHSYAYLSTVDDFPDRQFPKPLWKQPAELQPKLLAAKEAVRGSVANLESAQPPLYYTIAGLSWNVCRHLGLSDGNRIYALRFLNAFFVVALVILGYTTARIVFPAQVFPRLAVPLLIAFFPQTIFYSINNDLLTAVTFSLTFLLLTKWMRTDPPDARLGAALGIAVAVSFLAKMSTVPLIAATFAAVLAKAALPAKGKKISASLPALAALFISAAVPMAAWMATCRVRFGDLTGTAFKMNRLHWTYQPFGEWWHHPLFTPHGFWYFLSGNIASLWQGEFWWNGKPMTLPLSNLIYVILTLIFVGTAMVAIIRDRKSQSFPPLALSFACVTVAFLFYGFLSVIYDFDGCAYPSREHPYFVSGRLLLGALVPFLLLFTWGIQRAFHRSDRAKWIALVTLLGFMLLSEIATDFPAFTNEYNWFHM